MTTNTNEQATSTTVETSNRIPTDTMRNIASFHDAVAVAQSMGGVKVDQVLGDGFNMVEKDLLLSREMIVLDWAFCKSDRFKDDEGNDSEFVTVRAVLSDDTKAFFTDGSGVYRQLKGLETVQPIYVPRGLRKSDFTFTNAKGHEEVGTSYWLNTAGQ